MVCFSRSQAEVVDAPVCRVSLVAKKNIGISRQTFGYQVVLLKILFP